MSPLEFSTSDGANEPPGLFETSMGAEKVTPPSVERANQTSPGTLFAAAHTTLMLPLKSTAICCCPASHGSFDSFRGGVKRTWACALSTDAARAKPRSAARLTD